MTESTLHNEVPFPVAVEFLSDWAFGTGTSRHASVDRQIERDADGLPVVPGKALAAMLRDAAETVAAGLDEGTGTVWREWLAVLFGSDRGTAGSGSTAPPRPAALQARPLRLPAPVREAITRLPEPTRSLAREATVRLRPGVSISGETGAAVDERLWLEERAAAGLVLTADWKVRLASLPVGAPVPWELELLLRAAARLVDAVGGRRRRGAGRCQVRIGDDNCLDRLLDQVDAARPPDTALPQPAAVVAPARLGGRRTGPLRHRYDLRITALTPLVVPRGETGNTVLAESFLPGRVLLPLVSRGLGPGVTELVTGGRVTVTDATVELAGQRSLPLPRALQREKRAESVRPGQPTQLVNVLRQPATGGGPRLVSHGGFCVPVGDAVYLGEPALLSRAHAVIDDESQRPTERSGGFFVYEAMTAGTVLRAELWLADGVAFDPAAVEGEQALGLSKKDDYGLVRVEVREVASNEGTTPAAEGEAAEGDLVVWLTSDLLLTGEALEPTTDVSVLAAALGEALGVALDLPDPGDGAATVVATTRRTESWHSAWGLPRPSLTGFAGGSVFRFSMTGRPDPEAYRRVMANGLGERTAEGYGRLWLQPPLLATPTVAVRAEPVPPAGVGDQLDDLPPVVGELAIRGWRHELARLAVARARDASVRARLVPSGASPAQLGTLRTLAERLTTPEGRHEAHRWVCGVRERRAGVWSAGDHKRPERLAGLLAPEPDMNLLWRLLDEPLVPEELKAELYWPALAALLSEAARTEARGRTDRDDAGVEDAEQEVPA